MRARDVRRGRALPTAALLIFVAVLSSAPAEAQGSVRHINRARFRHRAWNLNRDYADEQARAEQEIQARERARAREEQQAAADGERQLQAWRQAHARKQAQEDARAKRQAQQRQRAQQEARASQQRQSRPEARPPRPTPDERAAARERKRAQADFGQRSDLPSTGRIGGSAPPASRGHSDHVDWDAARHRFPDTGAEADGGWEERRRELDGRVAQSRGEGDARASEFGSPAAQYRAYEDGDALGSTLRELPGDATPLPGRPGTFTSNGVYFEERRGGGYEVVAPPRGAKVAALPNSAVRVVAGAETLLYDRGFFYRLDERSGTYEVTTPPAGTIVPSRPEDGRRVRLAGTDYHEYAGVYYRAIYRGGKVVWVVADVAR